MRIITVEQRRLKRMLSIVTSKEKKLYLFLTDCGISLNSVPNRFGFARIQIHFARNRSNSNPHNTGRTLPAGSAGVCRAAVAPPTPPSARSSGPQQTYADFLETKMYLYPICTLGWVKFSEWKKNRLWKLQNM